jgi:nucleoside-diphosphate-sugar epimerase
MTSQQDTDIPEAIHDVEQLERLLSTPSNGLVEVFKHLEGDLMILGVAGKMGPTLACMARRAFDLAGQPDRRVIGVARFSDPAYESWLNARGIETNRSNLLEPGALEQLPEVPNVVSMFAMKFGSTGQECETWATNTWLPSQVALRFRRSRIVAFSTGNVYSLAPITSRGSSETDVLNPVGEYGVSCLGRERLLEYLSRANGTPMAIIRLNYAVEMRYGILVDLARKVLAGEAIDVTMGYFNVIWQADANAMALQALAHAAAPPFVLNVTGPEVLSVRHVAARFGEIFERAVSFRGVEAADALLSDASESRRLFGPPRIEAERLIALTAEWLARGGATLDKPTRFETRDGRF